MYTTRNNKTLMPSAAIRQLVESARRTGTPDYYTGKRQNTRYAECMLLDAAEHERSATTVWPVSMENASLGGIAFWSKRSIRPGATVRIREFTSDESGAWITMRVVYCLVGIRGYLIGAANA